MSAPNSKQSRARGGDTSRLYVFSVVTVAVVLAMLAWRHPRGSEFVVEADMRYTRVHNVSGAPVIDEAEIGAIAEEIGTNDAIQASIASMDASWVERMVPQTDGQHDLAALMDRVFIRVEPDAEMGNHLIKLRFIGQPREFALKLVEKLTADFADLHNNAATVDEARKQISDTELEAERVASRIKELKTQLESYVNAQVEAARADHDLQQRKRELARRESSRPAPLPLLEQPEEPTIELVESPPTRSSLIQMPVVEALNPVWANLNARLTEAEQQLRELLVRKTSEHPDVQRAQILVTEIRKQLEQTPQFIDQGAPIASPTDIEINNETFALNQSVDPVEAADVTASDESSGIALDERSVTVTERSETGEFQTTDGPDNLDQNPSPTIAAFDEQSVRDQMLNSAVGSRLRQQIAAAEQRRQRQLAELKSLKQRRVQFRESTLLVGHPRMVAQHTDELQMSTFWSTLGIATMAGFAVSLMHKRPSVPDTIYSIGDAEKTLQNSVVGTISTSDGPLVLKPGTDTLPAYARPLVRFAELTVFASAAVVLLAVFSVPEFSTQLVDNPFAAFALAVDHVSNFVS